MHRPDVLRPEPQRKHHRHRLLIVLISLLLLSGVGAAGAGVYLHLIPFPFSEREVVNSPLDQPVEPPLPRPQPPATPPTPALLGDVAAVPEIEKLAKAFAGDWNTVETVQHGRAVPAGEGRRGSYRIRVTGGGTALVSEGASTGTIGGDLRWFITIWWEPDARRYRVLTCFRAPPDSGCQLRGTGRWDRNAFVNDYDEVVNGQRIRMRDVWSDITPRSNTLTELHDVGNGMMSPYVVSHNTRQSP